MSFLTPLYLVGAALIALPIVLHLLRRDVAPPVPFTAVSLLRKTTVDRSRRHRLRDLLLLAARVARCCCSPALSRGRTSPARRRPGGRPSSRSIDRSAWRRRRDSTRARGPGARGDRRRRSGDRVAVVAFDDRAEVVSAAGTAADARAALAALTPGFGATRYAAAFDKAAELLMDEAQRAVVVVSDLQRSGFDENERRAAGGDRARGPRCRRAARPTCRSPTRRWIRRQVVATVRNFGARPRTTDVRVVGRRSADAGQARDDSGGRRGGRGVRRAAGVRALKVAIDDADGYAADNERFALAETRTLPRVLIVGGRAGASARVLPVARAAGRGRGGRRLRGPDRRRAARLPAMPADSVREQSVIMMLSTHGLDRRAGESLRGFLAGGGGMFIAAGQDVDPAVAVDAARVAAAARAARARRRRAGRDRSPPSGAPAVRCRGRQLRPGRVRSRLADRPATAWRVVARYTNGGTGAGRALTRRRDACCCSRRTWIAGGTTSRCIPAFVPFAQEVARYLGARPPAVSAYLVADVPAGVAPRRCPGLVAVGRREPRTPWRSTWTRVRAPWSASRRRNSRSW